MTKASVKLMKVIKSPRPGKKYRAVFDIDGRRKVTDFGAKGMLDYTLTGDEERRDQYRLRHKKDLHTGDPTRAGFLSYYLLWGPFSSLKKNIAHFVVKFRLGPYALGNEPPG
jgi:hypothetical protein